jgi:hypothetical protein
MTEIVDPDRHFRLRDLSRVDGRIQPRSLGDNVAVRRDDSTGECVGANPGRGAVKSCCPSRPVWRGAWSIAPAPPTMWAFAQATPWRCTRERVGHAHALDAAKSPHVRKPRTPSRCAGGSHAAVGAIRRGDPSAGQSGAREPFGAAAKGLDDKT